MFSCDQRPPFTSANGQSFAKSAGGWNPSFASHNFYWNFKRIFMVRG